jgi:alkanesulfonate monooxygenase SsuD/methylene tetrahydromethanopterin reductase-like flavin-dependent oxidoreductase (luciferase family)
MQFAVFDHLDRRDEPLQKFYDDRLKLAAAAERLGFYAYHIAEHHGTPLGMAPSPSVFLAALAQRTSSIRIGPMVYLLALYPPLRLIEEISMIDNLCGGRLHVGVGRAVSPHESGFFGVDFEDGWNHYAEALDVITTGLYADRLDWDSARFRYEDVPIELHPMQDPVPLWCAPAQPLSIELAAQYGMHIVSLGPVARVKEISDAYREAWDTHKNSARRRYSAVNGGDPFIGAYRLIYVANSDAEARRTIGPAFDHWFDSIAKLWRERGGSSSLLLMDSYEKACAAGMMVAGSPETVRDALASQAEETGFDYAMLEFAFGDLGHDREMASLELFAAEVMPGLKAL